jgi:hypothetical protein
MDAIAVDDKAADHGEEPGGNVLAVGSGSSACCDARIAAFCQMSSARCQSSPASVRRCAA